MEKTKTCTKCSLTKPIEDFHKRGDGTGTYHSHCKECTKEYRKKYYAKNREAAIKYSMETNKKRTAEIRQFLYEYLMEHPCVECGEPDPIVLEFDHINPSEKRYAISEIASTYRLSNENILKEIAKCEVRCANCHKRRTAQQFGWWKYKPA